MDTRKKIRIYTAAAIALTLIICSAAAMLTVWNRADERVAVVGSTQGDSPNEADEELRAVWIAYYSLYDVTPETLDDMVDRCADMGFNAIMFHVRPFGDAMYESELFPWSHIAAGKQGAAPDFDPLGYVVGKAHERGLELHAWINPLRIQMEGGRLPSWLSPANPYNTWRNDDDPTNDHWVIDHNKGKYYNPAVKEVRELITGGIAEIVENYDVDGIHWDDYFYPTDDDSFDDSYSYNEYLSSGGRLTLSEWRTENINALVRESYATVKGIRPDCVFGISPAGNIENCLNAGADVYEWCSSEGYIDYICPQVYWPFDSKVAPFSPRCLEWKAMITNPDIKFYVGLALYKAGSDADSGLWLQSSDIIARQIDYCRSEELDADGYMVFSYDDMLSDAAAAETLNMTERNKVAAGQTAADDE